MLTAGKSKPLRVTKPITGRTSNDSSKTTIVAVWITGLLMPMTSTPSLPDGPSGNSFYLRTSSGGRRSFSS
ncbi:hypothetical protein C367_03349 [Cryptococcus neoformans Ze90-1]|nr:hypothetical protein C367_03349 [Cryptococcus neoformans var. grubii Ze90-1]